MSSARSEPGSWTWAPNVTTHLRDDKFIISCAARTGSTLLERLLRSHPDILCHGEIMQPGKVGPMRGTVRDLRDESDDVEGLLFRYLGEKPAAFLYDIVFDSHGKLAVGFKFKTDEAFDARFPHINRISDIIGGDPDIKVIRLRRQDLLAQYISHEVLMRQTKQPYIETGETRPVPTPFTADPAAVARYCLDVTFREQRASKMFRNHRQHHVVYEELTDSDSDAQAKLCDFLGVPLRPLTTDTQRVLPDSRRLLENATEVIAALEIIGFPDGRYPCHVR